jgi:hypothetical protein
MLETKKVKESITTAMDVQKWHFIAKCSNKISLKSTHVCAMDQMIEYGM